MSNNLAVSIVPSDEHPETTVLEIWNSTRKLTAYITAIEDVFQVDDTCQTVEEVRSLIDAWKWVCNAG